MHELTIRPAGLSDIALMLDWAASEGWNPGLEDARLFQQADPGGFFMAFAAQTPAAAISVVRHDEQHGFLGLYICHPDYRGRGYGWALWKAGMQFLEGRVVGLDGVVEQQDNYRRSGFELAYRNIRFAGSSAGITAGITAGVTAGVKASKTASTRDLTASHHGKTECRPYAGADRPALLAMDGRIHGYARNALLDSWFTDSDTRRSMVCTDNGELQAVGTIRECAEGFKVGPLMANAPGYARLLLAHLIETTGAQSIILDVPEPNRAALALADSAGLKPVFETARMYRGTPPPCQLGGLYGVASFELG